MRVPDDPYRPLLSRPAFKPVALLLLVPVIAAAASFAAVVLAPPFVGAAYVVKEIDRRLTAAGADFTKIPRFPERSTIYANDGRTVLATVYLDNREIVELDEVSEVMREAVLAIEDSGFYRHGPLDYSALLRALVINYKEGGFVQGGSTITTQLVKNTLGLDPFDRSFERKFQELALAIRVEEQYSKDQILELYLNEVYLGNGTYGVGTAADLYFHKDPSQLKLPQAALLAGLIRAPADYDPIVDPELAKLRRNDVINRMMALGWVDEERGEEAKTKPLGLAKNAGKLRLKRLPFFVSYLQDLMVEDPEGSFERLGKTQNQRRRALFEGGLEIVTTLDPQWQRAADSAANAGWAVAPNGFGPAPEVGIVTVDNASGAIRTMLSGRRYARDAKDFVTTGHQPGSAYKPFILASAFEQGIPPTQVFDSSSPARFPGINQDGSTWVVDNAEGPGSRGLVDLWEATASSINVVFARLILEIGPGDVDDVTERMAALTGIKKNVRDIPGFASQATGSVEMSPLEMAAGFQTIANGGVHCIPYTIQSISRDGDRLYRHRRDCEQAIERDDANLITAMLRGVVNGGTASSAFGRFGSWPVAGKTGTAQQNTNVWFVGYTKQVSTSVWVGYPGNPQPLNNYFGTSVFGGTIAAPIWVTYMNRVMSGLPSAGFPAPPQPQTARLPSVVGLDVKAAIKELADAGFRATTRRVDSVESEGTVVGQRPGPGTVAEGSIVVLDVSTGVAPVVRVPDVVGMQQQAAGSALRAAGFKVALAREETNNGNKVGRVLSQSPIAGRKVDAGTTVTITIGVEPGPEAAAARRRGT
jgi:membrane peptidoglycan carboxypeptidase